MRKILFVFFGLFTIYSLSYSQTKIDFVYDLPCYSYTIDTPVTKFITTPAFNTFIDQVQKDINYTLQHYTINDFTTLSNYYLSLAQIHILKANYDTAINYIDKAKKLQWKDSYKQCFGLLYSNIAKTLKANHGSISADIFKKYITEDLNNIQWSTAHEVLETEHYQALLITKDRLNRQLDGIKNQMNYNKNITNQTAYDLIKQAVVSKYFIPIINDYETTLHAYLKKYTPAYPDYYLGCNEAKFSALIDTTKLHPVLVGYIDLSIDTTLFLNRLYTNINDPIDGKDNDSNGFVDDYHGLAYDSLDVPSKSLLTSFFSNNSKDVPEMYKIRKGVWDIRTCQQTPEAGYALKKYILNDNYEEYTKLQKKLGELGSAHGTCTADIILRNNPNAKLILNKTFFYDEDLSNFDRLNRYCRMIENMVMYCKKQGARVINMSWGYDFTYLLNTINKTNSVDVCMANKIAALYLNIIYNNLKNITASAPNILFTLSAGNANNDISFNMAIPANIDLPNVLTVGGIDCTNGFYFNSSIGKNVDIYANAWDKALFPGGERQLWVGTSFSAPRVANLAIKLLAINPNLNVQELRSLIMKGADFDSQKNIYILNPEKSMQLLYQQMQKNN